MPRLIRRLPLASAAALGLMHLASFPGATQVQQVQVGTPSDVVQVAPPLSNSPVSDPKAIATITQMIRAYQGLKSYTATESATGPEYMGLPYRMVLSYSRPNRVRVEVTRTQGNNPSRLQIVSDGVHYFAFNSRYPKRYLKTTPTKSRSATQTWSVLRQAFIAADVKLDFIVAFTERGGGRLQALTNHKSGRSVRMGQPDIVDGVAVDTILIEENDASHQSKGFLQIGQADHLLRRIQSTDDYPDSPPRTTTQTFTNVRINTTLPASKFVFTPPKGAMALTPADAAKPDPKAVAVLSRMDAAYKALRSFSCSAQSENVTPAHDSKGKVLIFRYQSRATYKFQQPNKIAFTRTNRSGTAQAFCDGQTLYATTNEDKSGPEEWLAHPRYLKKEAVTGTSWNDNRTLANFGGLPQYGGSGSLRWMPEMILGVNSMPATQGYSFQIGKPTIVNGEPVDMVFLKQQMTYQGGIPSDNAWVLKLYISQRDHLLRRVSEEWTSTDGTQRSVETYTDIKINPTLEPSTFQFTPPADAIAVDTVEALLPPRPVIGPQLRVGDTVPESAFNALDMDSHAIKAADYAGKVVVLDFWATWCGPCIKQMPTLVAAYRQYHEQGLEVIGYALEKAKEKDTIPAFAAKHEMPWRQVWDKDGVIANATGPVNGIPFAIIIGRDGRIAAIGNPGEGLDVEAAIKEALTKPVKASPSA